jgi:hypothetical protein
MITNNHDFFTINKRAEKMSRFNMITNKDEKAIRVMRAGLTWSLINKDEQLNKDELIENSCKSGDESVPPEDLTN